MDFDGNIVAECLSSQWGLLATYKGIFPSAAKRAHAECIDVVIESCLEQAQCSFKDLVECLLSGFICFLSVLKDCISVALGPGLAPCLEVGVRKAEAIARENNLPLIGVHHLEAHSLMPKMHNKLLKFPYLVLIVSGGHTQFALCEGVGVNKYVVLGDCLDDAVGEAFDKVWRLLFVFLRSFPEISEEQVKKWEMTHPGFKFCLCCSYLNVFILRASIGRSC